MYMTSVIDIYEVTFVPSLPVPLHHLRMVNINKSFLIFFKDLVNTLEEKGKGKGRESESQADLSTEWVAP